MFFIDTKEYEKEQKEIIEEINLERETLLKEYSFSIIVFLYLISILRIAVLALASLIGVFGILQIFKFLGL